MDLQIQKITNNNLSIYINLAHAYEAEFSSLTHKLPDLNGIYQPDSIPGDSCEGYLLFEHLLPVGFCLVNIDKPVYDIAEFYIGPVFRNKQYGKKFAFNIFSKYPGQWQVRQIKGAQHAILFWRSVIQEITDHQYHESIIEDPDWGEVTRQVFEIKQEQYLRQRDTSLNSG